MVELRGNIRIFNGNFIVNADFSISKNSVIFARNGSGKTTFLKGIAGLLRTEGELYLSGKRIDNLPPEKRRVVYVNQDPKLPMSVKRFTKLLKCDGAISELVPDFEQLTNKGLSELSLGQRQRLVVACTTLSKRDYEVIMLDESIDNVSDRLELLKALLAKANSLGRIVIFATNNPSGLNLFEQFFTLREGKLLEIEDYSNLTL